MSKHTVTAPSLGKDLTAQDLLTIASLFIQDAALSFLGCVGPYVERNALQGDAVCVTESQKDQAAVDTPSW
jgi:hypothetical protein